MIKYSLCPACNSEGPIARISEEFYLCMNENCRVIRFEGKDQ